MLFRSVPFVNPIPNVVLDCARVFAAELLYKRRGTADKENPWASQAKTLRDKLAAIVKGDEPLTPEIQRANPSVSVVTEPAKTSSKQTKLAT